MADDKFKEGDRVFAKMKGYPAWPALVVNRLPGRVEAYNVYFYGTYQSAKVKPDSMYQYNDETKAKFGKTQRKGGATADFKRAMDEIENNIEFGTEEVQAEAEAAPPAIEPEDEEGGDLVIDESLPPVLKREGKISPSPSASTKKPGEAKVTPSTNTKKPTADGKLTPSAGTKKAAQPKATPGSGTKKAAKKLKTPKTPVVPTPPPASADPEDTAESAILTPAPVAAPTPPPKGRRGSKTNKKDLGLSHPSTPEPPSTPAVPPPEVKTRSGRQIKPKRFADEEVEFSMPGSGSKSAASEAKSGEGGPTPAKRPKRLSTGPSKALLDTSATLSPTTPTTPVATPKTEEALPPPPPLERPKLAAKRNTTAKRKSTGNLSVAESEDDAAPKLVVARPPPPLRAMPTLTPAPTISSAEVAPASAKVPKKKAPPKPKVPEPVTEADTPVKTEEMETTPLETKAEEADTETKGEEMIPEEPIKADLTLEEDSLPSSKPEDSSNPATPEGEGEQEYAESNDPNTQDTDDEGTGKENTLQEDAVQTENGVGTESDDVPIVPKRMRVDLQNGTASAILGFNHNRPTYFRTETEAIAYDMATARNVLQTKVHLEVNETAFLKAVADSLPVYSGSEAGEAEETEARIQLRSDQIHKKILQLRMEGEMIEIIGELVGSLQLKFALCDRALDLLDKLASRTDVNTLALKKHPEVVDVIRKIQNYHGNISQWKNLNQAQIEEFHVKAEMIREKAISIYQSFKLLFCMAPEKPFYEKFMEEVTNFEDAITTAGIQPQSKMVFALCEDPSKISEK